ncbi:MAG TPA: phosphoribosyltransferase family protein [Gemmatimonadales bacterium]|nr:phosphoribosyltransferase family protein [Gemmatimonadales bacterium]
MQSLWSGVTGEAIYTDRAEAGRVLARQLAAHRGTHPVVLGIPRGGVPVAAVLAQELEGELDIVVARKLGAPFQPELALGAVTADGHRFLNDEIIALVGLDESYLDRATAEQRAEAQRREQRFRGDRQPVPLEGRTVILVDDGLATGATMRAAVRAVRARKPARLIVAVPVGAADTCEAIAREVDELVCPARPEPFRAVGVHYEQFEQVEDDVVARLLARP